MKSAGLRIRVDSELRGLFVTACKANDMSAAQVLRAYMRKYVHQNNASSQRDLFAIGLQTNASDTDIVT